MDYVKSAEVIENLALRKMYINIILESILIIFAIVCFVWFVIFITKNKFKRMRALEVFISLVLIVVCFVSSWDLSKHILDVVNKSYVIYSGSYYKYETNNIKLENGETLLCNRCELDTGKQYNGYVIYSERSKKVLDHGNENQAKQILMYENIK